MQTRFNKAAMQDKVFSRAAKRKATTSTLSAAKKRAAEAQGQTCINDFFKKPTVTPPVGDKTNAAASSTETTRPEPVCSPVPGEMASKVVSRTVELTSDSTGTEAVSTCGTVIHGGFTTTDLEIMLSETEWLNDDVLNKCLELARSKSPKGDFIKVFDTGAATAYSRPAADLSFMGSGPMQIFPVCDGTHWIVCIFVNLGEAAPACLVLDSGKRYSRLDVPSTENSPNDMYDLVHGLVANVERVFAKSVPKHILDVPQQPNGHDCGCYVYYFVEQMMEWFDRVVAGDYESLAWHFEIQARNHMRQACLDKEAISAVLSQTTSAPASTSPAPASTEVENEAPGPMTAASSPASSPKPEPVPATSDNDEKSPPGPAQPKWATETVDNFIDKLVAHNAAVLEICREKRLDETSNPLIKEVQHAYDVIMRGLREGRTEMTLRTNFKKLARSITSLSSALCTGDAESHGKMEEYRRFVEDSAGENSKIVAAAPKLRKAPGAPQRKPRRTARLPEDSGKSNASDEAQYAPGPSNVKDVYKLQKFDIPSIQTPVVGIGADEEVWLPSGGFKKMRDLEEGDLVLNRTGKPVKVLKAATVVEADSFEITRDSKAVDSNLVTRQRVTVGAVQRLEVTLQQIPKKINCIGQEPRPYAQCRFLEIISTVWSKEQVVDKPRKQSLSVSYGASDGTPASTKEEAVQMLKDRLSALNIPQIIRYYPKVCDLVRFNEPEDVSLRYYFAAANIEPTARDMAEVTFGVMQTPVPAELSPEREEVARMLQRFSPDVQANALYLMGLWVGDGKMERPFIAVDSLDIESMRLCAEYASQLGVDCDILYEHIDHCDFSGFSGYREDAKSLWIRLSDPTGFLPEGEEELEAFRQIIIKKDEKAREWRKHWIGSTKSNPYRPGAVLVALCDSSAQDGPRNLIWDLFLLTRAQRPHGEWVKSVPLWLAISPVEWREAFLAGLVESQGYRKVDAYLIATKIPEVRDGLVSLARSLGIPANAQFIRKGIGMDRFRVHLDKCDALDRAMLRVASPRKLPDGTPPGPEWVAEPIEDNFTCTPRGTTEIASGVEVEGHEFLMKSFFVMLDSKVEPDSQRRVVEYLVGNKCIANGCDRKAGPPSWDNRLGKLCGKHNGRLNMTRVYCTACNHVPTLTEMRKSSLCEMCRQPSLKEAEPDQEHFARIV